MIGGLGIRELGDMGIEGLWGCEIGALEKWGTMEFGGMGIKALGD